MKKIFLGSDHGGYALKQEIIAHLQAQDYDCEDVGCDREVSCDYPPFGVAVGKAVVSTPGSLGVVICGSGVGISIAANKVKGVRCVLTNNLQVTRLARVHNDANVLALGGRTPFLDDPLRIVETFLEKKADHAERHVLRRSMLDELPEEHIEKI